MRKRILNESMRCKQASSFRELISFNRRRQFHLRRPDDHFAVQFWNLSAKFFLPN